MPQAIKICRRQDRTSKSAAHLELPSQAGIDDVDSALLTTAQQSRYGVHVLEILDPDDTNCVEDGPLQEPRPDRQEAHCAVQAPPERPLQMCRPELEEASWH